MQNAKNFSQRPNAAKRANIGW